MHLFLIVFFLIYLAVTFAWPTWRLWRRHGIQGIVLPVDDTAHGLIGTWFKGLMAGMFVFALFVAFKADPTYFGPLPWAIHPNIQALGAAFMVGSLMWVAVAQAQMDRSWRIGFDPSATPELITTGIFARSRNPIFLGMRVTLLGLFLFKPCAVTLALLVLSEALIPIQVRLEEGYLTSKLGDTYRAYQARTPRWL
jgi:protein-S-isoprenylcysteine O-methyltransferase Ste14